LFVAFPVATLFATVIGNLLDPVGLFDFRIYRAAGIVVLHGHNPYFTPQSIVAHGSGGFVYPAPAAWAMVPFGLLPFTLAGICFSVLTTAAVVASLLALDVRDIRCYGVALFMAPVSTAITTGTVSTLIACAAVLTWRYRNRVVVSALALGASLMLKPLLWPIAIWLAATRRWRAAGFTLLTAGVGTAAGYAALHINGLQSYPALVRATTSVEGGVSYSLFGLLSRLSAPAPLVISYLVGAVLLAALCVAARHNEQASFVIAIAATLALAPVLWVHYFSLLLVPLAFRSRRLTAWWFLPILMWLFNAKAPEANAETAATIWLMALAVLIAPLAAARHPQRPSRQALAAAAAELEAT
jgi:alpha-1,2-mannosyltransferase